MPPRTRPRRWSQLSRWLRRSAFAGRLLEHQPSGIKEWNLILMSDRPTSREGKYDPNTLFPNGWFFKQVGSDASLD